jgi:cyclic beta-1,2-glucan synthetase
VYQDLFGEGSFIGKGIYEVDAFERALAGRFPENRILSHDLLEGCYARAGLLSDVQLYEENPSGYSVDVNRRHRWIRGDWQLAGWLLPRVPGPGVRRQKNPLSGLSRWKLFDNLRRSLVPSALTVLLLLGWTVLSPAWLWTLSVIGIILIPPLLAVILDLIQKPEDVLPEQHFAPILRSAGRNAVQTVLMMTFLPYEAFFSMGAIVRTIWRMWVTHTRLLEWTPSSTQERGRRTDLVAHWRMMWIGPLLATAALIYLMLSEPGALAVAMPILGLWFASPAVAWCGSANRSFSAKRISRATRRSFSRRLPERPGPSSRSLSVRKIIGCRLITFRNILLQWSRIARRRPIWDSRC